MTRQKQRKVVFQLVYSLNYRGTDDLNAVLEEFYAAREEEERYSYIDDSLKGICERWEEINEMLEPAIANWSINRVSAVCIAILRLAVYEIKFNDEIPDRVAINEAIELAKEFGDNDSGKFVHGVLSYIAK